jgi:histidinol dehydrogenase
MTTPTPKQKLIEAVKEKINKSFEVFQSTSNCKNALRKFGEVKAYERALDLIEEILPNE